MKKVIKKKLISVRLVSLGSFGKVKKIQAMGFNKQNITLHGLHVHDDARFSVGFLCRCCTKFPGGEFFFLTSDEKLNFSFPLNFD